MAEVKGKNRMTANNMFNDNDDDDNDDDDWGYAFEAINGACLLNYEPFLIHPPTVAAGCCRRDFERRTASLGGIKQA